MENTSSTLRNSENIVQNAYDILRAEGYQLSADVSCVIPYLIVYLRAGYPINRFLSGEPLIPIKIPVQEIANEFGYNSGLTQTSSANEALHFLEAAISRLRQPALHRILDLLSTLRLPAKSQEEFRFIFDSALDYLFQAASRSLGGQHLMPPELVQFVAQVFQIHTGESIYNPFAGTCQLAGYLAAEVRSFGQEPDPLLQALAMLRLSAYQQHNATVVVQSPVQQWPANQLWDVVLATGLVFDIRSAASVATAGLPANTRPDSAFVHRVVNSLREGGRAVIPVTSTFLWRSDRAQIAFRQQLVESGVLEAVIEMPNGLLAGTGVGFSLLLLRKVSGRKTEPVLFLDAAPHTSGQYQRKVLNVEALTHALHSRAENEYARFVTLPELAANEYSLSARRYLTPVQLHPNDVQLGEFAQFVQRPRRVSPAVGRFVNIRQLLSESPAYEPDWYSLKWSDLPLESIDRLAIPLTEDALLVAAQGSSLKPTWFTYRPEASILLANSVTAMHLDLQRVDVEYLVTELNSDHVLLQLRAMQTGSTVTALSRQELMRLRVRLPKELSQQRAVVTGIREQLAKQKEKEANALRANRVQKAESYAQLAALKHALGRPQLNLTSNVDLLEAAIQLAASNNQILAPHSPLFPTESTTVQDTIAAIKRDLEFMYQTLNRNEAELILDDYSLQTIDILAFLQEEVAHIRVGLPPFTITLTENFVPVHGDSTTGFHVVQRIDSVTVQANKYLLKLLLNHVIDNAQRHGFDGRSKEYNNISITVEEMFLDEDLNSFALNMTIANNGHPFPLNFDVAQLTRKGAKAGSTGNTGIGGYEVQQIVGYFEGKLEIIGQSDAEYPVAYQLELPVVDVQYKEVKQ